MLLMKRNKVFFEVIKTMGSILEGEFLYGGRGEVQLYVYIDVLFFWNVIMNLILLFLTKWLRRKKTSFVRILLGAAFGAFVSCFTAVMSSIPGILSIFLGFCLTGVLMILIAFGWKGRKCFLYNYLYFIIVTFIFGGMLYSLVNSINVQYLFNKYYEQISRKGVPATLIAILVLVLIPFMVFLAIHWKQKVKEEQCYYDVMLKMEEKCITCRGFLDTGNSLYDPVNGKPVILMNKGMLSSLYQEIEINHPEKIRYIPYRSVGKENGLLQGIRFDEVIIENGEESYSNSFVTVALSENEFKHKKDFQVLLHSGLLGQ